MKLHSFWLHLVVIVLLALIIALRQKNRGYTFIKTFISAFIGLLSLYGLIVGMIEY